VDQKVEEVKTGTLGLIDIISCKILLIMDIIINLLLKGAEATCCSDS